MITLRKQDIELIKEALAVEGKLSQDRRQQRFEQLEKMFENAEVVLIKSKTTT